jgi:hypothetical protein
MKIASRLVLGTLVTAAALGGSAVGAVSAHAADSGGGGLDDAASAELTSALCPIASSGAIGTLLNGLNPESITRSCGGLHNGPAGTPAPQG